MTPDPTQTETETPMRTLPARTRRRLATAAVLLTLSCGGDSPSGPSGGNNQPDLTAVATVTVSPMSGTVDMGATLQFTASPKNSAGSAVSSTVTWTSGTTAVAMVDASGLVTGVAAGSAVVTASAGGRSGAATVTVVDPTPPTAPSDLAAVAFSNTQVDLTWTDNAGNESGFVIEREPASSSDAFAEVGTAAANGTAFRDQGLAAATGYRYRVRARNANGDSEATTAVEVTTHDALVITTAALDDGTQNQAYTETLGATGGNGTYHWNLKSGTLPAGLALSDAGVISGTPTAVDSASVILAVASGGQTAEKAYTLVVREQILAPEVVTTTLKSGAVGAAYSATLEAHRGDGTYAWSLAGGTLPAGLTLAADGTVSGTPTTAGTKSFSVQVQSAGLSGTGSVSLAIYPALAVVTDSLPPGRVGHAYTATFTASGGNGAYTWAPISGVPAGLALDIAGVLSGTPTATGSSHVAVKVTSGDGQISTGLAKLVIFDTLRVTTTSLAGGTVGQAYSATLVAAGGSGSNTWSVTAGTLPAGLALAASTGVISGTPTASDTASFTVRATSSDGQQATKALEITVVAGPVTVTTTSLTSAVVGAAYTATLTAAGGNGSSFAWNVSAGALPDGLALAAGTGVISGTPTTAATSNFTVQATSGGRSGTRALSLTVNAASAPGYNIELVYQTALNPTHQAAFENAKSRWESIVTGDVPDSGPLGDCGSFHPATDHPVDDLIIYVTVDSIDGVGGTLGQAGPCYIRSASGLPISGAMTFDEADLDWLSGQGLLVSTVLHEMGHILGIGTRWADLGLLSGDCLVDPIFTGSGAVAAFNASGGSSYVGGKVPVENTGTLDDGSNCSHWRETVLGRELMTPALNSGGANPLSIVTVQSLGDLGYAVTNAGADSYVVPAPSPAAVAAQEGGNSVLLLNDILPTPILRMTPDGRVEVVRPARASGGR